VGNLLKITKGGNLPPSVKSNVISTGESTINQRYEFIPIDFLKCQVIGLPVNHFINNPLLKFTSEFKNDTGEITKSTAKFKNLKITIYQSNRIEFSGSLHTYWNDGKHNHNDFSIYALEAALKSLKIDLGITPKDLYLIQLEYGVNILPPVETNEIINHLHQHKSRAKTVKIDCPIDGKYSQFKHDKYILKCYNKGKQFGLPVEVFRIEIKETNWSKNRQKGIVSLLDFLNADKTPFISNLIENWQSVVFYSPKLGGNNPLSKYDNPNFWLQLRQAKSNTTFKKHFDKLKQLNITKGGNIQNKVASSIRVKIKDLGPQQGVTNSDLTFKKTGGY
jgi:hypothetical protein